MSLHKLMDLDHFTIEEKYQFWKWKNICWLISLEFFNQSHFSILFPIYLAFPKWHNQKTIEFWTWITLPLSHSIAPKRLITTCIWNENNVVNIQKRHLPPRISVCWLAYHHPPRKYLLKKYHTHRKSVNWNPPPPPDPGKKLLQSKGGARIFDGTALIERLDCISLYKYVNVLNCLNHVWTWGDQLFFSHFFSINTLQKNSLLDHYFDNI